VLKTYHTRFGLTVSLTPERVVTVPPFRGSLRPTFARSVTAGGGS
jgi:hypothetical protein